MKCMRFLPVLAICLLSFSASPAAAPPLAEPLTERIDAIFAPYERPGVPGCVVGVFGAGDILFARGYGAANLEHDVPLTPRSVLRIASTSKQFTAMAVLLLEEDGTLALDDDLRDHVPEFPETRTPIRLDHLLHHTSGVRDYLSLLRLAGVRDDEVVTSRDVLDLLVRQSGLTSLPGQRFLYSNSGYFLLAEVVARAARRPFREVVRERIFEPLGMTSTHVHDDRTRIVPRRATGYAPSRRGGFEIARTDIEAVGDGGVFTSLIDLARWDANFYDNRLGRGEQTLVEKLLEPGELVWGDDLGYAGGLEIGVHDGVPVVSHGGSFVGYRAELIRYPTERIAVACLCNRADAPADEYARQIGELLLHDVMTREEDREAATRRVDVDPEVLERYVGRYEVGAGVVLSVSRDDESLVVTSSGSGRVPLRARTPTRFSIEGGRTELEFIPRRGGRVERLKLIRDDDVVSGRRIRGPAPTEKDLRRIEGRYESRDLRVVYAVERDGDGLVLRVGRDAPVRLEPLGGDAFAARGMRFTFERNRRQRVRAMTVDAGPIRGLVFAKLDDRERR